MPGRPACRTWFQGSTLADPAICFPPFRQVWCGKRAIGGDSQGRPQRHSHAASPIKRQYGAGIGAVPWLDGIREIWNPGPLGTSGQGALAPRLLLRHSAPQGAPPDQPDQKQQHPYPHRLRQVDVVRERRVRPPRVRPRAAPARRARRHAPWPTVGERREDDELIGGIGRSAGGRRWRPWRCGLESTYAAHDMARVRCGRWGMPSRSC